jgi:SAM-dependent methyltransferase
MEAIGRLRRRTSLPLYELRLALTQPRRLPARLRKRQRRHQFAQTRSAFRQPYYLRLNSRRLEHLTSLGLPLAGRSVLEVGAGVGDLTGYFVDRGCSVVATEARPENLAALRDEQPDVDARLLDLDAPDPAFDVSAEIVFCYGLLYHLARPAEALAFLRERCSRMLLLETWVSPGPGVSLNPVPETRSSVTQAFGGSGCRPTRGWVFQELQRNFPHVYATTTQPWCGDFPLDWSAEAPSPFTRAVFVASLHLLQNDALTAELPIVQTRH